MFLLDRSGSMAGTRMESAKKAMIFFLKSLPPDSLFNIVSFGTRYEQMFGTSRVTSNVNIEYALEKVFHFKADMQGTDIYSPLSIVLDEKETREYPKHVFLLTDGAVGNTDKILRVVEEERKYSTVHGIGIGDGCSMELIRGCAENSWGRSTWISDEEDPAEKIITLLFAALSPVITDF